MAYLSVGPRRDGFAILEDNRVLQRLEITIRETRIFVVIVLRLELRKVAKTEREVNCYRYRPNFM